MTSDTTWDAGWQEARERGDILEMWMLEQDSPLDDDGRLQPGLACLDELEVIEETDYELPFVIEI